MDHEESRMIAVSLEDRETVVHDEMQGTETKIQGTEKEERSVEAGQATFVVVFFLAVYEKLSVKCASDICIMSTTKLFIDITS